MAKEENEKFVETITKMNIKSRESRFENKNESSIQFSEFNNSHQLILDKILNQNKDIDTYDRIEDFKNWFINNFMEKLQSDTKK